MLTSTPDKSKLSTGKRIRINELNKVNQLIRSEFKTMIRANYSDDYVRGMCNVLRLMGERKKAIRNGE